MNVKNYKNFFNPPGGFVIALFVFAEIIVFALALVTFIVEKHAEPDLFRISQSFLNQKTGLINTIILILSGAFVASATQAFENKKYEQSGHSLIISATLGIIFIVVKLLEFSDKIELVPQEIGNGPFFDYYWILTAFHALHVLLGIPILIVTGVLVYKNKTFVEDDFNIHTAANYWHMCDLIWIMIYSVIYLY